MPDVLAALRRLQKDGKTVLGMRIFEGSALVKQRDECMRSDQSLGLRDAMTTGFEAPAQVEDTLTLMAQHPAARLLGS